MKRKILKINESQLRNLIKKSINEAVCEDEYDLPWTDRKPKNNMDRLKLSRYNGLVEIIEYYSAQEDDGKPLSKEQYEQLKNACDTIECFGEPGQKWAEFGREILSKNEHVSINESKLRNIIKESIKKILKEGLYDGYVLHAYIPGLGNKSVLVKSMDDAKKYIGNAEYWDITKGSNSSDPSNLIAWGGEGGYWYNVVNKPAWATGGTWKKLPDSQIQYILSKKQN